MLRRLKRSENARKNVSKINYKFWGKLYRPIYVISIILLFAVLIPKIGHSANGATRWIKITESLTFQPSEIVKVGMIIFFSRYFTENIWVFNVH